MVRKQIYLDEEIIEYLENESKLEHKSVSDLIRQNIRKNMESGADGLIRVMKKVAGIRKDREEDVYNTVRNLRKDRNADA